MTDLSPACYKKATDRAIKRTATKKEKAENTAVFI